MTYLMNAWYPAAWSGELADGALVARTLLEKPLVLFRDSAGHAVALDDMCPHRFAPLSIGSLKGDMIECRYHGLGFNTAGACVSSPQTPGHLPPRAKVKSYALVERQKMVWIWMGEAPADTGLLPDFPQVDDTAHWRTVTGRSVIPGHYLLAVDNLLDLSHPEFLHDGSLGSPALATAHYEFTMESPRVAHSNRWFEEGPIPPAIGRAFPTDGKPVEHWTNMRWQAPSVLWLDVGATFTGRPREQGRRVYAHHMLTPETANTCHYFWSSIRPDKLEDEAEDERTRVRLESIFEGEDAWMIAAVQERMGARGLFDMKPVILPGDQGAIRVRRALQALIDAEQAVTAAPARAEA